MPEGPQNPHRNPLLRGFLRGVTEVAFIIFLFYSNLLMSQFSAQERTGKTLSVALHNIITPENLAIAIISATVGYIALEYLRKRI